MDPSARDQRLFRRLDEAALGTGTVLSAAERARAGAVRDRIAHALLSDTARRAAEVALLDPLPDLPAHRDWTWRPSLWRAPSDPAAWEAQAAETRLSGDVALFHDCPLGEIGVRQRRGEAPPFALGFDIYAFRGSYLSLAVTLPPEALSGLRRRHVIRIDVRLRCERPALAYARLNVQRGAAPATIVRELPAPPQRAFVDFDLAFLKTDLTRAETVWVDLIFDDPRANGIVLEDMLLSRTPRAEV